MQTTANLDWNVVIKLTHHTTHDVVTQSSNEGVENVVDYTTPSEVSVQLYICTLTNVQLNKIIRANRSFTVNKI